MFKNFKKYDQSKYVIVILFILIQLRHDYKYIHFVTKVIS